VLFSSVMVSKRISDGRATVPGASAAPGDALLVEREDAFPVILHAYDYPILLRFVVQRLGEGAVPG